MELSSDEIAQRVKGFRRQAERGITVAQIRMQNLPFYEKYPKLLEAAADIHFPMTFLSMMLEQKSKLAQSSTTLEEANNDIYGTLKKEYIDPVFPNGIPIPEGAEGADGADEEMPDLVKIVE